MTHTRSTCALRQLHDWDVDFAAWCTYKYLNSGPGSIGGAFVHDKHSSADLPKLTGWWGTNKTTRCVRSLSRRGDCYEAVAFDRLSPPADSASQP